jgi:hypothetical protein
MTAVLIPVCDIDNNVFNQLIIYKKYAVEIRQETKLSNIANPNE